MLRFYKLFIIFLLIFAICLTLTYPAKSQPSNTHKLCVITLKVETKTNPNPQIKVSWDKHPYAESYDIRRKSLDDAGFPNNALAQLDSNTTFFSDDNVEIGQDYEYEVRGYYKAKQNFSIPDGAGGYKDSVLTVYFMATGYVYSGVEADVKSRYEKCLLLIDEEMSNSLPGEITRLEDDLIKEGWEVVKKLVPRTETYDATAVKNIKNIIIAEAQKDLNKRMYIFILGRVAAAYSGQIFPDGHGNHVGAWPCDGYYGSMNENNWTDFSINNSTASRAENKNIPGDGKFDQNTFQYNQVNYPVGRVDFYNMPTFKLSETELLKRYLDKDHQYRTGQMPYLNRGLIDDNFGISINACASSAYRSFSLFFGMDSVKDKTNGMDWFPSLSKENYLWAYGCGGGNYPSAGGIGDSEQFDTIKVNAIFTMLFGSYFGDWDSPNNLMRASLASEPSILTCSWSGFPQQYYHHMGLGMPIGHSIMISQNNIYNYLGFVYLNGNKWNVNGQGLGQIHVALMGDPTLRMYMGTVPEPTNLTTVQLPAKKVELSWIAPDVPGNFKYNVYRSEEPSGPFTKITEESISPTKFMDSNIVFGSVYYMVRTENIETTNSGSFKNLSRGIIKSLNVSDVSEYQKLACTVSCYPNPATKEVNISLVLDNPAQAGIEIFDSRGTLLKSYDFGTMAQGEQNISWNLVSSNGIAVSSGVYYVKVSANDKIRVEKFTVIR